MKKLITIMINSIKDEFIFGYIPIAIALICGGVSYIFYPDHILATILLSFLIVELGLVLIYKKKQKIENQQLSRAEFFTQAK